MTIPVWPFMPEAEVTESLEWLTDITRCKLAEYRSALRPYPRLYLTYKHFMAPAEYGLGKEIIRSAGVGPLWVPEWTALQQIASISAGTVTLPVTTTQAPAYTPGNQVIIWTSNLSWETGAIQSVSSSSVTLTAGTTASHANPWIAPMRQMLIGQDLSYDPVAYDNVALPQVGFVGTATEDLVLFNGGPSTLYNTYLGSPVVTDPTELINGAQQHEMREHEELDSRAGSIVRYALYSTPNHGTVIAWTTTDASSLWALRWFFHTQKGRWKNMWVSSRNADIKINKDIGGGDGSVQIDDIGFRSTYSLPADFMIATASGGATCFRVTAAAAGTTGNEVLTISGAFSGGCPAASILQTSKLTLSRFDADRIEIQHKMGQQATIVVPVIEVPIYP